MNLVSQQSGKFQNSLIVLSQFDKNLVPVIPFCSFFQQHTNIKLLNIQSRTN